MPADSKKQQVPSLFCSAEMHQARLRCPSQLVAQCWVSVQTSFHARWASELGWVEHLLGILPAPSSKWH